MNDAAALLRWRGYEPEAIRIYIITWIALGNTLAKMAAGEKSFSSFLSFFFHFSSFSTPPPRHGNRGCLESFSDSLFLFRPFHFRLVTVKSIFFSAATFFFIKTVG
jgi:hypothetical protein